MLKSKLRINLTTFNKTIILFIYKQKYKNKDNFQFKLHNSKLKWNLSECVISDKHMYDIFKRHTKKINYNVYAKINKWLSKK